MRTSTYEFWCTQLSLLTAASAFKGQDRRRGGWSAHRSSLVGQLSQGVLEVFFKSHCQQIPCKVVAGARGPPIGRVAWNPWSKHFLPPCWGAEPRHSHPSPAWATQMLGSGRLPRVHPKEVLTPLYSAALRGHSAVCAGHPSPQLSTCHKMTSALGFFWKFQGWLRSPVRHQTSHGPVGWSATWPGLGVHLAWPWRGTPSHHHGPRWRRSWPQTSCWRGQTAPRREAEFSCPDPTGNVLQPQTARPPETVQPQLGPGSLPGFTCRSLCLPLPPLPRGGVHLAAQAGTDLRGESAVPSAEESPRPTTGAFPVVRPSVL